MLWVLIISISLISPCFHGEKKKNINTYGLKKASYQKLCVGTQ